MTFIQFKEKDDEYAGWMNYVASGGKNEITKAGVKYAVTINSGEKDVAVRFWNSNNQQANLDLWYTV